MKKFFAIITILSVSLSAFAQASFVKHTVDGESKWSINLMGLGVNSSNNRFDFDLHRDYTDFGTPGFYFGLSNIAGCDRDFKPANSLEFGFSPLDFAWWNNRQSFGIITSLGISWTRYAFKDPVTIEGANGHYAIVPLSGIYTGNSNPRITYASWRLPIEAAWSSNCCLFTLGVEGELRHHLRMRTKFENPINGEVTKHHHYLADNNLGVNPWGINAVGSIGCKGVSVYGRVALTKFFDKNDISIDGTPFMVGIRFYNNL